MIYLIYPRSLTIQSEPYKVIADVWDDTSSIGVMIFKNEIKDPENGNLPSGKFEVLKTEYVLDEMVRMTAKKYEGDKETQVWPRS